MSKNRTDALAELDLPDTTSVALLQALHILTRDGRINQDSRRKLKQVRHLVQFITPLLDAVAASGRAPHVVDVGAGKSYLGFMLWDMWFAKRPAPAQGHVSGIERRAELVAQAQAQAKQFGFGGMRFAPIDTAQGMPLEWGAVDIVTALHACDSATDDAISFAVQAQAEHVVLVPCCQAELAAVFRRTKASQAHNPLADLWRHPLHTRELGSQLTNVLRCLRLEAAGYRVSVTELVGWEHSMKNELIVASRHPDVPKERADKRMRELLAQFGLDKSPEVLKRHALT